MDESTTGDSPAKTGVETTLPDDSSLNKPADEHGDAKSGGETQGEGKGSDDKDTGDGKQAKTSESEDDEGLAKFAKSQGIDNLDDLTERERKLLKSARDSQRDFHKKRQAEKDELRKEMSDLNDPKKVVEGSEDLSKYEQELLQTRAEVAQLKAMQRVKDFWDENPDAREYEPEMRELVKQEREEYGDEAARVLTRNLKRLYTLAKAERGDSNPDSIREQARKEEREELRRKQEGSAETGSAQNSGTSRKSKIDQDWIDNTYDPSNAEHRKMLDAYFAGS